MEAMVKKYQQKFRKVKDEMSRWDELQSRLISQFNSASSIIQRLQVLHSNSFLSYYIKPNFVFFLYFYLFVYIVHVAEPKIFGTRAWLLLYLFVCIGFGIVGCVQLLQDSKNYGSLNCVAGIGDGLLRKQLESLEVIFLSLKRTM